jgi:hypothetical protein
MAKKAAYTGTQKKAHKQEAKAQNVQAKIYQKQAPQEYKQRKSASHRVTQVGKGRHIPEYEGKTKYEPSKFKAETKYEPTKFKPETKYEHRTLGQLQKDFERAGRGLEPMFEARKQAALADYAQNLAPEVTGQYGQGTAGSSALFQAQNAAKANLQRNLSADFETMRNNIAGSLLGAREQQRQFSAQFGGAQENFYNQLRAQQEQYKSQFGAGQEQFGANLRNQQQQFASQFGAGQEQNIYNSQLQALNARLNANQLLMGHPVNTNFTALQSPYLQAGGGAAGPTIGQRYASSTAGAATGAGTGFLVGGPPGAVIGGITGGIGGLQLGQ